MIPLARKNLLSEKTKLVTSVGGVALAILVMVTPLAVYLGAIEQARALPLNAGADLWVVQKDSGDLFHTFSLLPDGYAEQLAAADDVLTAGSITNNATRVDVNNKKVTVRVIGSDVNHKLAMPWRMYEGDAAMESGEVVVDRSFAVKYGLSIGDSIKIAGENFTISGIALDANTMVFQYLFIRGEEARRLLNQEGVTNYYLLDVVPGSSERVTGAIADLVPNGTVVQKETIADFNGQVIKDSFLPIIALIVLIGLLVGVAVIGLTIYSATIERAKEYGVLKAIGVKNARLYRIVFAQAIILSGAGFVGGTALYAVVRRLAFSFFPEVTLYFPPLFYGYLLLLVLVMSLIASAIPVQRINRIDPLLVFKS